MGKCALCKSRTPGMFKTLCPRCHFIKETMQTHGVEQTLSVIRRATRELRAIDKPQQHSQPGSGPASSNASPRGSLPENKTEGKNEPRKRAETEGAAAAAKTQKAAWNEPEEMETADAVRRRANTDPAASGGAKDGKDGKKQPQAAATASGAAAGGASDDGKKKVGPVKQQQAQQAGPQNLQQKPQQGANPQQKQPGASAQQKPQQKPQQGTNAQQKPAAQPQQQQQQQKTTNRKPSTSANSDTPTSAAPSSSAAAVAAAAIAAAAAPPTDSTTSATTDNTDATATNNTDTPPSPSGIQAGPHRRSGRLKEIYIVKHPFTATEEKQLTIKKGDVITIRAKHPHGWWSGVLMDGRRGWVPGDFLRPAKPQQLASMGLTEEAVLAVGGTGSPSMSRSNLGNASPGLARAPISPLGGSVDDLLSPTTSSTPNAKTGEAASAADMSTASINPNPVSAAGAPSNGDSVPVLKISSVESDARNPEAVVAGADGKAEAADSGNGDVIYAGITTAVVASTDRLYYAKFAFDAQQPRQLSIKKRDILRLRAEKPSGWWQVDLLSPTLDTVVASGWVPGQFLKAFKPTVAGAEPSTASSTPLAASIGEDASKEPAINGAAATPNNKPAGSSESESAKDLVTTVTFVKREGQGLGMGIGGGKIDTETGQVTPIFINKLVDGSVAAESGLVRQGDVLLSVNGVSLVGKEQHEVANLLKTMPQKVTFEVQHSSALERKLSKRQMQRNNKDADSKDNNTPTPTTATTTTSSATATSGSTRSSQDDSFVDMTLIIQKAAGESLGFGVATAQNKHLTIKRLMEDGVAAKSGLQQNDVIISANGITFEGCTHQEAVDKFMTLVQDTRIEMKIQRKRGPGSSSTMETKATKPAESTAAVKISLDTNREPASSEITPPKKQQRVSTIDGGLPMGFGDDENDSKLSANLLRAGNRSPPLAKSSPRLARKLLDMPDDSPPPQRRSRSPTVLPDDADSVRQGPIRSFREPLLSNEEEEAVKTLSGPLSPEEERRQNDEDAFEKEWSGLQNKQQDRSAELKAYKEQAMARERARSVNKSLSGSQSSNEDSTNKDQPSASSSSQQQNHVNENGGDGNSNSSSPRQSLQRQSKADEHEESHHHEVKRKPKLQDDEEDKPRMITAVVQQPVESKTNHEQNDESDDEEDRPKMITATSRSPPPPVDAPIPSDDDEEEQEKQEKGRRNNARDDEGPRMITAKVEAVTHSNRDSTEINDGQEPSRQSSPEKMVERDAPHTDNLTSMTLAGITTTATTDDQPNESDDASSQVDAWWATPDTKRSSEATVESRIREEDDEGNAAPDVPNDEPPEIPHTDLPDGDDDVNDDDNTTVSNQSRTSADELFATPSTTPISDDRQSEARKKADEAKMKAKEDARQRAKAILERRKSFGSSES